MGDNGPFLSYGAHAGDASPLREGKLTAFEGGVRTPCLMRWPGKITADTELHAIRSGTWKLYLAHTYLTKINDEVRDDGKPAGFGSLAPKSITQSGVEGIASRHGYRIEHQAQSLYNLGSDPGESTDVSGQNADVVQR